MRQARQHHAPVILHEDGGIRGERHGLEERLESRRLDTTGRHAEKLAIRATDWIDKQRCKLLVEMSSRQLNER